MSKQDKKTSLEEITRIIFPTDITPREVGVLLEHIAKSLNCTFKYQEQVNHSIQPEDSKVTHNHETIRMDGMIHTIPPSLTILSFGLTRVLTDKESLYSALKFFTTPGYDIEEINPPELLLMDKIGQAIDTYFTSP